MTTSDLRDIPLSSIRQDPDQPRQIFNEDALRELAQSIEANGLIQPITVRPIAGEPDLYVIVAGERRYRAHGLLQRETIAAVIDATSNDVQAAERSIIENLQRVDIAPLEEAKAFKRMIDTHGHTVESLAKAVGIKQAWRISDRLALLALSEAHQSLLQSGNITPSQAFELSQLESESARSTLMKAINRGQCPTYNSLRAARLALTDAEQQQSIFAIEDLPEPPTKAEVRSAATFEKRVETIAAMLRSGISDNEIIAMKKVAPTRASTVADQLAAMVTDLRRIEEALRTMAIQQELADAA